MIASAAVALVVAVVSGVADTPEVSAESQHSRTLTPQLETESTIRLESAAHAQVRLTEIGKELVQLRYRPTFGEVFVDSLKRVAP